MDSGSLKHSSPEKNKRILNSRKIVIFYSFFGLYAIYKIFARNTLVSIGLAFVIAQLAPFGALFWKDQSWNHIGFPLVVVLAPMHSNSFYSKLHIYSGPFLHRFISGYSSAL
jgi:hypothetical protein